MDTSEQVQIQEEVETESSVSFAVIASKQLPWWFVSAAFHALMILFLTLLTFVSPKMDEVELVEIGRAHV